MFAMRSPRDVTNGIGARMTAQPVHKNMATIGGLLFAALD
jgi:hypothetical protein